MECKAKSGHKLGSDLSEILEKRQARSECSEEECAAIIQQTQDVQDLTRMLSRKEVREYQTLFNRFDRDTDGYLCLEDLKLMMETLGAPQTHLSLKKMIQEVDTDGDSKISFQEFLLIYHKAKAGQLDEDSGLSALAKITEVDIHEVGVDGAKNFFEAKIEQLKSQNKFEAEVKKEQEEKRKQEIEKKQKRLEFQQKHAFFEQVTLTN
ncbi:unnamed protein product [Orchesella dallaii]|uniref:EF-hand domain-containing protein n=1 Tax=Orchesella dallaii TaxID=48710 RepID=A0ABP1QC01_9HEXA